MRILIVDSDLIMVKSLSGMIRSFISDVESIDMCNSVHLVSSMIEEYRYNLVLVNESIQNNLGFTAIGKVREKYPYVQLVVYSDEESCAIYKKCIQYWVTDYLITPITVDHIHHMLNRFLKLRKINRSELVKNREELDKQSNELIELSFIYSVLFNGDINCEWERYQSLLNISNSGYVIYISFDKENYHGGFELNKFSKAIKEKVSPGYRCIIGKEIARRIVIFVMAEYGLEKERNNSRAEQLRFGKSIRSVLKETFDIDVKIGIGSEKTVDKLPISYEEALRNIRYDGALQYQRYKDETMTQREHDQFYNEMEQKFFNNIREGNQEAMNHLLTLLDLMNDYSIMDKKNKIIELVVVASHIARMDGKNESEYTNYIELIRQLNGLDSDEINAWACRCVMYIIKSVRDIQNETSFADIRKVLQYIDTHYDEDISLEEASSVINISPQYLSRIFREKTGKTYVDYLTSVRIKKAKEWLSYSESNIQEVCFKVGYKDPNYFTRVFKKVEGITPRQFKCARKKNG